MLHTPFILLLGLAGAAEECDRRAVIAGQLMMLRQAGAGAPDLSAAARTTGMPSFASSLVARVVSVETSPDISAREVVAYHFAAEIHGECHAPVYMS